MIDRYVTKSLGSVPLSKLRAGDLDRFYRTLQNRGGVDGAPLLRPRRFVVFTSSCDELSARESGGRLGVNPAAAASPPRVTSPEITPPSSAHVGALLRRDVGDDPALACFLMLSAGTGARRSELVGLRWADVDLPNRAVMIRHGARWRGGEGHEDTRSSTNRLGRAGRRGARPSLAGTGRGAEARTRLNA